MKICESASEVKGNRGGGMGANSMLVLLLLDHYGKIVIDQATTQTERTIAHSLLYYFQFIEIHQRHLTVERFLYEAHAIVTNSRHCSYCRLPVPQKWRIRTGIPCQSGLTLPLDWLLSTCCT